MSSWFFELALEDITQAAVPFRANYERTWVASMAMSRSEFRPYLAHDAKATLAAAIDLSHRAAPKTQRALIKIPGTAEGLWAIEESIFAGIPINVTLLFSSEQYLAAAEAYMRGIERRIEKGLRPDVASVASLFVSRWDVAVTGKVPAPLVNKLGIAIGTRAYKAYCDLLASTRCLLADECRRPATATAACEHWNEGPERLGDTLRGGSGGAVHCRHHA